MPRTGVLGASAVVLLFVFAVGMTILRGTSSPRAEYDQNNYHLPAIRQFAREWPSLNVVDYRSATTPGYHITLAAVQRVGGWSEAEQLGPLRRAGAVFGIALVGTLGLWVARRGFGAWETFALTLPIACSPYVFTSAAWLLPDDAGWWLLLVCLLLVWLPRPSANAMILASIALLALVLVRQINLWAAAILWLATWLRPAPPGTEDGGPGRVDTTTASTYLVGKDVRPRVVRLIAGLFATAPALVAMWWFWRQWGGLVPPMFQGGAMDRLLNQPAAKNQGFTGASLTAILALAGLMTPFYIGYLSDGLRRLVGGDRWIRKVVFTGVVIGLALALPSPSTYSVEAGRWSGLWVIAQKLPWLTVAGRSMPMVLLAGAGGGLLALVFACLGPRDRWLFAGTMLAFMAAQLPAQYAWQRYYEPVLIMVLTLAAVRVVRPQAPWSDAESSRTGPPGAPGWATLGPATLGLLLAVVTLVRT